MPGTLIEDPPCLHPLTLKRPRARPSPSSSPARQSGQESFYPSLLDFPSSGSFCSYDLAPSSHPSWTVNPLTITPTAKANCRPQNSGHCQSGGSLEQPPQKQTQLLLFLFRDTPHLRRPTVGVSGGHLLSQMEHLHLPLFSPHQPNCQINYLSPNQFSSPPGPQRRVG